MVASALTVSLREALPKTTGFSFGSNAVGAQWDGTMYGGGKVDLNWDSKWISEVVYDDEKWV